MPTDEDRAFSASLAPLSEAGFAANLDSYNYSILEQFDALLDIEVTLPTSHAERSPLKLLAS